MDKNNDFSKAYMMDNHSVDGKTRERVISLIKGVGIATQAVINPVGAIGFTAAFELLGNAANDFCDCYIEKKQRQEYLDNYIELLYEAKDIKGLKQSDKIVYVKMASEVFASLRDKKCDSDDLNELKAIVSAEVRKEFPNTGDQDYRLVENVVLYALTLIRFITADTDIVKYLVNENISRKNEVDHINDELCSVSLRVSSLEEMEKTIGESTLESERSDSIISEYSKRFKEALYLHKDNKNVNLKNLYVIPDVSNIYQKEKKTSNLFDFLTTSFITQTKPLILLGDAGSGKTTVVSWLAYKFHEERNLVDSKKLFSDKQLLIVKLRDVNKSDIRDEGLYDAICKYLHKEHNENVFRDKYVILDGMDEISLTEKYVNYNQIFKEISTKISDAFKLIITSRSSIVSDETVKDIHGIIAYSVYELNPFDNSKKQEWIAKYEKCTSDKIVDEIKDRFLSTTDDSIFDYPQLMYMIAGEKGKSDTWSLDNEWSIYHHIFYDVVFSKEYDDKTHPFEKYKDTVYRVLELIGYEMYLDYSDTKLEKKQVYDLLSALDDSHLKDSKELLDAFEKYGYGLGCYWKIDNDAEIEFFHNNIRDFFIAEYIFRGLNEIFSSVVDSSVFSSYCKNHHDKPDDKLSEIAFRLYELLRGIPISCEVVHFLLQRAAFLEHCEAIKTKDTFVRFLLNNVHMIESKNPHLYDQDLDYPFSEFIKELFYDIGIYHRLSKDVRLNVIDKIAIFINNVLTIVHAILGEFAKDKYITVFGRNSLLQNTVLSSIYKTCIYDRYVNFNRAYLMYADFEGAFLECAELSGALLEDATFENAKIEGTNFKWSKLYRANFSGTDMNDSSFECADLSRATFARAFMDGSDFTGAIFDSTYLADTDCVDSYAIIDGKSYTFSSVKDLKSKFGLSKFEIH